MKKLFYLFTLSLIFVACSKDKDVPGPDDSNLPGQPFVYLNTNSGSTWNYQEVDGEGDDTETTDYIVTTSEQKQTFEGNEYTVYDISGSDDKQYLRKDGDDYYEYSEDYANLGVSVDRLYLKGDAKKGDKWSQTLNITAPSPSGGDPITIDVTLQNEVISIGDRTINGVPYKNVIQVKTTLDSPLLSLVGLTSDINGWYAPDFGMIESTTIVKLDAYDVNVSVHTTLQSGNMK